MKSTVLLLTAAALLCGSGCSIFREQEQQYRLAMRKQAEDRVCERFLAEYNRMKPLLEDPSISASERWASIQQLRQISPKTIGRRLPKESAELKKLADAVTLERTAELKKLADAADKLAAEKIHDPEDHLIDCRDLLRRIRACRGLEGAAEAEAKLSAHLGTFFRTDPERIISAEKEYRESPSRLNQDILEIGLAHFSAEETPKYRSKVRQIRRNLESVKKTEQAFAHFTAFRGRDFWTRFKNQARQIGYARTDNAKRRFIDYIQAVENCRMILFRLKGWEFVGSGFFEWGTCDLDVRIWPAGRGTPRSCQISVEDAGGNWYNDPARRSRGKVRSASYSLTDFSGAPLRQINFHFQNSDGRTVKSPVMEISIYELAALTWKTGEGELKLESYPANRPPRGNKGAVIFQLQDMPRLETFAD